MDNKNSKDNDIEMTDVDLAGVPPPAYQGEVPGATLRPQPNTNKVGTRRQSMFARRASNATKRRSSVRSSWYYAQDSAAAALRSLQDSIDQAIVSIQESVDAAELISASLGIVPKDESSDEEEGVDKYLVDWEGPDDPANPYNWGKGIRWAHVIVAGITAFLSNMTATAFAPAASLLREEFGITDPTLSALTVSIYLLGFAIGPLLIAPLSEHYGRRPIYSICLALTIAFLVGCSETQEINAFLVCRLITGITSSGPGTIGSGTIADVMPPAQRGGAMAIFAIGPLLSNTIGPLVAGPVGYYLGWRWLFRIIYISNFVNFCMAMIFMRETFAPVLLRRKAARLRKETGNQEYYTKHDHKGTPLQSLGLAIVKPTKMLLFSPIVWSLSIYCAFVWGLLILLFTSFPDVYKHQYGFGMTNIGVAYIGSGIGMTIGAVSFGIIADKMAKKRKADETYTWTPESRLELMVWFAPISPIGFFWYGWAVQGGAPAWVPIMGTSFIGMGALYIVMPVQMYLVECFGAKGAASAIAANTVLRSLFGCFLPLAGPSLNSNLGLGWGNTLLGGIGVVFVSLPILFYKYGGYLRTRYPINI